MNIQLCALTTCRIPGRHGDRCPGSDCRGCQHAHAADGLRLCQHHTNRIGPDATTLAELHAELALRLLDGTSTGERVAGTPNDTRIPNPAAVDARTEIRHLLAAWCRLIAEQRGWTLPTDTVEAMGTYTARNATWLAATEYAAEAATELADLKHRAWTIAYPNGTHIHDIAPCPLNNCGGTVRAVLRATDSLLPSELVCDTNPEHRWGPAQWHTFGRAVKAKAA